MSQFDFNIEKYKEVVYEAVLDLHIMDGISFDDLAKAAGYKGASSIKNVVQQRSHDLEFSRGLALMMFVSSVHNNKRLHKHVIDTSEEMIVKRPKLERAKGDMDQETMEVVRSIHEGADAVKMSDPRQMRETYYRVQDYLVRLREEIDCSESIIAKKGTKEEVDAVYRK